VDGGESVEDDIDVTILRESGESPRCQQLEADKHGRTLLYRHWSDRDDEPD
jgi:hypothetical protein